MYGLKDVHIDKIRSVFANFTEIDKAILYGSRAKGNYRNGSDIDISLIGKDFNLSKLLRMETELDDLLLPYQIDVSIFDKIEDSDLIEHINRVGIVIYDKNTMPDGVQHMAK